MPATPEIASVADRVTATAPRSQPVAVAAGVRVAVVLGAVLSMSIPPTVVVFMFPARSVAVPVTLWPCPSVVTVVGGAQVATPDVSSVQAKLTTTSLVLHPPRPAAGVRVPLMLGAVASRFTETEAAPVPAAFVAVQFSVAPVVSATIVVGPQPLLEVIA